MSDEDDDERERDRRRRHLEDLSYPSVREQFEMTVANVFTGKDMFGVRDDTSYLQREIDSGAVSAKEIVMPASRFDPDEIESRFHEGSYLHKKLCARVATWMELQGLKWHSDRPPYEGVYNGYADVRAIDRPLYAECGNTNVKKTMFALLNNDEVLVFPYSSQLALLFTRIGDMELHRFQRHCRVWCGPRCPQCIRDGYWSNRS